ncbi:1-Cys peroxiredoxin [Impatiens glandulifera]|uniref:1-Cys peroxiredoxin n=1 Tax=Impatiens glandulifera TaxID=253017 RepID=UPI001FB1847A|nr:1-Cys peroxiredoxin [Impatiens glandulifera]
MPGLTIGDIIPNLEVETTKGKFKIHDFIGENWILLFSHPGDFTPVCTTELGMMAKYSKQFIEKGVKLLGLSCDDLTSHMEWIKDIESNNGGHKVDYPIIGDSKREIIKQLNMVDPDEKDGKGNNMPSRALHIIGPDKKIKLSFLYPATTGRNMDEVLRVVESLQKARKYNNKVATPVNWNPGEKVVIAPSVTDEDARKMFPQGFQTVDLPSNKKYLRYAQV